MKAQCKINPRCGSHKRNPRSSSPSQCDQELLYYRNKKTEVVGQTTSTKNKTFIVSFHLKHCVACLVYCTDLKK